MTVSQFSFTQAILDPDMAVPAGLTDPQGRADTKRFAVYRNNVAVGLTDALAATFPVIQKLVGEEFFAAMAGVFLRQHPPTSPLMMFYGQAMPEFLGDFDPVNHLGYLPDIARLELAMRHSYHAGDATAIDPAALESLVPDSLLAAKLHLAPAAQLVRSQWPIHAIYLFNTQPNAPEPQMHAQDVLITRPEFDPFANLLGAGGAGFVQALMNGETFAQAMADAGDEFDLTGALAVLLSGAAITKITLKEAP